MVMGATNRPQDVDKAILRRMATTFHIKPPVSNDSLNLLIHDTELHVVCLKSYCCLIFQAFKLLYKYKQNK